VTWALLVVAVLGIALLVQTSRQITWTGTLLVGGYAAASGAGVSLFDTNEAGYITMRFAAAALAGTLALAHMPGLVRLLVTEKWLGATALLALTSLWWTQDLTAGVTALLGFLTAIFLGGLLALHETPLGGVRFLARLFGALSVGGATLAILLPNVGTTLAPRPGGDVITIPVGLFAWNSELGFTAAVSAVFSLGLAITTRSLRWSGFAVGMVAVTIFSESATAVVALVGGIAAATWVNFKSARLPVSVCVAVAVITADIDKLFSGSLGLLGRTADFTGRTAIWEYVLYEIESRPWLGHGIGQEPNLQAVFGFTGHAHNGYIAAAYSLGILGAGLVGGSIVATAVRTLRKGGATVAGLLVTFLVSNLANNFLISAYVSTALYAWVALSLARDDDRCGTHPSGNDLMLRQITAGGRWPQTPTARPQS
jgi:hypothetical protein